MLVAAGQVTELEGNKAKFRISPNTPPIEVNFLGKDKEGLKVGANLIIQADLRTRKEEKTVTYFDSYRFFLLDSVCEFTYVSLIGRLGQDVELKYFDSGKSVASVSIAVRRGKDVTDWVKVTAWERTGEILSNYAHKGDMIAIEGFIKTREYDGFTYVDVNASKLELLGGGKNSSPPQERVMEPAF
jgi:hypothetical protein